MAMEEAHVNIDPFKSVEALVKETVKALRPIIPIKFAEMRFAVKIPADYAPRAYGELHTATTVEREESAPGGKPAGDGNAQQETRHE